MEGTCACAVRVSQRSGRIVMVLGESEIRQKLKLWQTPQGLLGGYRFLLARPASGPLVSSGGRKILSVTEFATRAVMTDMCVLSRLLLFTSSSARLTVTEFDTEFAAQHVRAHTLRASQIRR